MMDAILRHTSLLSMVQTDLFSSLQKAFSCEKRCPAQIILLTKILHTTWVERNLLTRQGNKFRFPLEHVIDKKCSIVDGGPKD